MATTLATPVFHAGRRGDEIRGDVWMGFLPADSGGLQLDFTSKLESMYGQSTRDFLLTLCNEAGVEHGTLFVEDKGAYPFVLRARLESLLQQVLDDSGLRLHHEAPLGDGLPPVEPKRMRRSRLYLPGNEAKYMLNAALHEPDGIILDLEDSVAPAAKFDARAMVRHALHCLDFGDCERMVRINQGEMGMEDLAYLKDAPFHLVLIPKVETAEEVQALEPIVADRDLLFMPIIESAKGVLNADAIAKASPRIVALTLGLEDLTADLGVVKTPGGKETAFACSWVIHAAKANGLQAIDSVYGNIADEEGLRHSLREAKAKGFEGKGCVHPRQIRVVHEEFAPSAAEIERACKITRAFEEAEAKGLGVVSLGSKMIDPPVVKRALTVVSFAIRASLIEENWRTNFK
ncbi:MAG: citrate lyase ACP [Planctomycetes bacterium]|nr:citrate lyase ACP [Planctomycetota bacterium]